MTYISKKLSGIALVFLAGCANLQSVKIASVPANIQGHTAMISGNSASKDGVAPRAEPLGNDGVYLVQSGGGSLALGLLLGPVGMAINNANVTSETEKIRKSAAPSSLIQLKPLEELHMAVPNSGSQSTAAINAVQASPYLIFHVDNERKNLYAVAGLRVDAPQNNNAKKPNWNGHYLYAIDQSLSADVLKNPLSDEELRAFRSKVRSAYVQLWNELNSDLSVAPSVVKSKQIANVKSPYLKAIQIGFAGFTAGDVVVSPTGSMSMRINIENYGPAMDRSVPYFVWYFPSASQYTFDLGPEDRKTSN